jgi:DNA-nicking Smr family endonuclease
VAKPPKDPTFTHEDVQEWKDALKYVRPREGSAIKESDEQTPAPATAPSRIKLSDLVPPTPAKQSVKKPKNLGYLDLNNSSHVDGNLATKLRKGTLRIEGKLDLHGYYHEDAIDAFSGFIEHAAHAGKRCVLIVTGKGKDAPKEFGVLHQNAPRWINNIPHVRENVLMFCHCPPNLGGEGAILILLKRKRAER